MENLNIDGINNIDSVKELFSSVKCIENENCFLVVYNRDYVADFNGNQALTNNATVVGAKNGGIAGGIAGGIIANSIGNAVQEAVNDFNSKLNDKQRIIFDTSLYCGFLINVTSKGLGVIPLTNNRKLLVKVKDFKTDIDNFVFFNNDEIEKMEIQKLPLYFSSKKLAIYFKGLGNVSTQWTLPKKHKLISFQEENFKKLVDLLK